ncbi:MAG TPA: RNA polymerase subunit sigma [Nitrospinae bacterium]|nr:RNA polymerase subunit sigma [Nitrospinota bacterium]HBA27650.1 RNA polymerase subunit sigma [Nitrospinota bacterium]
MEDDKKEKFEQIAVPYFNILYNSAYRMTGNRNNAEDLVQDVFLSAYKSFHQFVEGTNCKAWLFKILRNTFINRIKKEMREVRGVQEVRSSGGEEFHSSTHQLINSSTVMDEGFDETIQKSLNKLPEEFRMAIILCDVEGFSYQEISEVLECPVGTVRSRINRARRFLAEELKDLRA